MKVKTGVIHRDVSPHNIFVQFDGQVKLLDFGVAKMRGALSTTSTGVVKGKLAYMAPEVLMGEPLDRRADIFSIGVMLWEALARTKITRGRSDVELTGSRVAGVTPDVRSLAPDAPEALVELCERAMAKNPADRFPTALALREALEEQIPKDATSAALGAFVTERFCSRRENIRSSIHEYLQQSGEHESLPSLPMSEVSSSSKVVVTDSSQVTNLEVHEPKAKSKAPRLALAAGLILLGAAGVGWFATRSGEANGAAVSATDSSSATQPAVVASAPAASKSSVSATATAAEASTRLDAGRDADEELDETAPRRGSRSPRRWAGTRPAPPAEGADLAKPEDTGSRPIFEEDPYAQ